MCVDPGEKEAILEAGGPGLCQGREKAGSWLQTVEEDRRSGTAKDAGDRLATPSRDVFAQSEFIVHCVAVVQYNHNRNRFSLYYLFQENISFGTDHHLHSSSDVREVVSSTILIQDFSTRSQINFVCQLIILCMKLLFENNFFCPIDFEKKLVGCSSLCSIFFALGYVRKKCHVFWEPRDKNPPSVKCVSSYIYTLPSIT